MNASSGRPVVVLGQHERARLVLPLDAVEVEELGEPPLGVVGEAGSPVRVQDVSPLR